jgi:hypothetical protein
MRPLAPGKALSAGAARPVSATARSTTIAVVALNNISDPLLEVTSRR